VACRDTRTRMCRPPRTRFVPSGRSIVYPGADSAGLNRLRDGLGTSPANRTRASAPGKSVRSPQAQCLARIARWWTAGSACESLSLLPDPQPLADSCDESGHEASLRRFVNRSANLLVQSAPGKASAVAFHCSHDGHPKAPITSARHSLQCPSRQASVSTWNLVSSPKTSRSSMRFA
jgi:hypothetical protein